MNTLKTLSLFGLIGVARAALGSPPDDVSKIIQAYYAKDGVIMKKLDFDGLYKHELANSTRDFVNILLPGKDGKVKTRTRADDYASSKQLVPFVDSITTYDTRVDQVTVHGNLAVAIVSATISMKTKGAPAAHGVHVITSVSTDRDTWVKVGGSWKIKSSQQLKDKMYVNGKLRTPK